MSIVHKAFVFDHSAFREELSPTLYDALHRDDPRELRAFIKKNLSALRDPDEGGPGGLKWETLLEAQDVQRLGDIALTKYYDPGQNLGLAHEWEILDRALSRAGHPGLLIGVAFGPVLNFFDPGNMGSYFITADQVRERLVILEGLTREDWLADLIPSLLDLYRQAGSRGRGLYVTF